MIFPCRTCLHWQHDATETKECRRFPPQVLLVGDEIVSRFPLTGPNDGCGEYLRNHRADAPKQETDHG